NRHSVFPAAKHSTDEPDEASSMRIDIDQMASQHRKDGNAAQAVDELITFCSAWIDVPGFKPVSARLNIGQLVSNWTIRQHTKLKVIERLQDASRSAQLVAPVLENRACDSFIPPRGAPFYGLRTV